MSTTKSVFPLRTEQLFNVQAAKSANNQFAGYQIPQNPYIAPNDFGSPHQDSWCTESVSMDGPTSARLKLTIQQNPFGYTPNMVCNSNNQMIGVSLSASMQFWLVVFDADCHLLSATALGKMTSGSFGGGYFYLDNNDNTIVVSDDKILSFPTQNVQLETDGSLGSLEPNWTSDNIIQMVTDQYNADNASMPNFTPADWTQNGLYANLPVWTAENTYWCLISGNYQNYQNPTTTKPAELVSMAGIAVVHVDTDGTTTLKGYQLLDNQWNNNSFSVDDEGAYFVTNGIDPVSGKPNSGYLWKAVYTPGNANGVSIEWQSAYQNAGYLKPGQTNIGSGTTPTLTKADDNTLLVAITDNADPQVNVVVYNREDGSLISETPCFEPMRSADEASLIGLGSTFIVENNFGHYAARNSQLVPNGKGMSKVEVNTENIGNVTLDGGQNPGDTIWELPEMHFYAMNMLCRGSGIIFAHTCNWADSISTTEGGMYYISAIDSYNGRVIWQIPLGRGVNYCHDYGGIYFNQNGDLFIGTMKNLICISNFQPPASQLKEAAVIANIQGKI